MPRRPLVIIALLFCAFFLVWKLDYAPFWNPDEGRYSAASYEMAFGLGNHGPDWVVPHLDTVARLNKPPLIYWTTAACFRAFGPSEISGRLPSALASLIILGLIFTWGRAAFGTREALGGALVWSTAAFPFAMGRVANTDMLLSCSITIACCGIFWAIESERRRPLFGILAGVGMGLALLAKGPVGVALPLVVAAVYLTTIKGWKKAPWGALLVALGVAIVIGAPWYMMVEARRPGWIRQFIVNENLGRFSGHEEYHKPTSKLFYLPIIVVGMLPWAGFFLACLSRFEPTSTREGRTKLFLGLWAFLITFFFSFSGTKLASYVLPVFPALALFTGASIARYELWPRVTRNVALGITLLVNLVVAIAIAGKPGVLIDNSIVPRAVGEPWSLTIVAVIVVGSILLGVAARRGDGKSMLMAKGINGFLLLGVLVPLIGKISKYEDGSSLFKKLEFRLQPNDRIASYMAFLPTSIYYSRRPVTFFKFRNSSGLDENELKTSPYFLTADQFPDYMTRGKGRTFVISEGPIWTGISQNLHLWGSNNDWFLYSDSAKPADFNYSYYNPRKKHKKMKKPVQPELDSLRGLRRDSSQH